MSYEHLKERTKQFALRVIRLVQSLPNDIVSREIGKQLIRSAMSVAANYRAACRARSRADFISKVTVAEEECDESQLWFELLIESRLVKAEKLKNLMKEADELTAILATSAITSKKNEQISKKRKK